jgi:hypothetical protein
MTNIEVLRRIKQRMDVLAQEIITGVNPERKDQAIDEILRLCDMMISLLK